MRSRRGQAALEYLVTYGWGILAILVVVGALGYFGFLNPSRYLPERCAFSAQMECIDYLLEGASGSDNGQVSLRFRNNFGDDITITRLFVSDMALTISSPGSTVPIEKGNVSVPIVATISTTNPTYLLSGERQELPVVVEFRRTNPVGPLHNVTGVIFAKIQ